MLKGKKSITPGQRHLLLIDKGTLLSKKKQKIKKFTKGKSNKGGRNNLGRVTVRHQGGGHKRLLRQINFKFNYSTGFLKTIEYDPNRSGFIGLFEDHKTKENHYILVTNGVSVFSKIEVASKNSKEVPVKDGNVVFLKQLPIGVFLNNLELIPGKGAQLIRSAGSSAQLMQQYKDYSLVKLPSGEKRLFSNNCKCVVGRMSNLHHQDQNLGKAGRARWLNKRPVVRGVAMNPIDHPHGGGEGKTAGGRPSVTPWGKLTKGQGTRKKRRKNRFIVERRKKVKNEN